MLPILFIAWLFEGHVESECLSDWIRLKYVFARKQVDAEEIALESLNIIVKT